MKKLHSRKIVGYFIIVLVSGCTCNDGVCDRRPLGTKTKPLRPDNQFVLEIEDIKENKYIPGKPYKVNLRSRDEKSTFIAFTISIKEDTTLNPDNPRKPLPLHPGRLEPLPNSNNAKSSTDCNNTIIESDVTQKTKVQAVWTAPGKNNKCVSIFAVVAVEPNVWYSFERPLSMRVCEDPRKSDDMPPTEVDGNCKTCEDARYQLTFEGLWSYNTHTTMFPSAKELARFSDVVGASHSPSTFLFKYASEASVGIKMLAEQGNTTQFEIEIQEKLPTLVRTVIKAISPAETIMSTVTSFRATPEHHRLSIAVGILPSPDWFLGVSNLELCNNESKWSDNIRLNLYPIDAGTDKGLDFESSNEEQSPPQPISQLTAIGKQQRQPDKPFARLHVNRIRTYTTLDCMTEAAITVDEGGEEVEYDNRGEGQDVTSSYVSQRTTTSEEPPTPIDPDSSDRCPMTKWDEWQPCEGICVNNTVIGLQSRFRYHIVDGNIIKNFEHGSPVSQYCLENFSDMDTQACEGTCNDGEEGEEEEDENYAEARRIWQDYRG